MREHELVGFQSEDMNEWLSCFLYGVRSPMMLMGQTDYVV